MCPPQPPSLAMQSRHLLFAFCASLFAFTAAAQPQWRFHLAFEDGTGARDTIWHVWDTTATGSWGPGDVDYDLGEGAVDMDLSAFNVFMWNWDGDSTKTQAEPYAYFPQHSGAEIYGFNYQYPITIRWDRSLFHAEYLPDPEAINMAMFAASDYFYWHGNDVWFGAHSILEEDSVVVGMEALGNPLFPMILIIDHNSGTNIFEQNGDPELSLTIRDEQLHVATRKAMEHLRVLDTAGRVVHDTAPMSTEALLDISDRPAGIYIVHVRTSTNTWYHGKFIKVAP